MEMKQNQIFSMGQIRIWYHFSMKNEEKMSFVSFLGTFSREYSLTRATITTIFRLSWKHFICIIKKHFKNILETSVLLWASKSCYRNWKFHFKSMWRKTVVYNYVVKNINIKKALFFSYLKKPGLKTKKQSC